MASAQSRANLTRSGTGTADTITAKGGTLDVAGNFASELVAAINSTAAADLKFDGTATSAAALSITSSNRTLEIGNAGTLTIGASQKVTLGAIKLGGGRNSAIAPSSRSEMGQATAR